MAIYVRPGGNDANGGTNDDTDALQTLNAAVAKYDYSDPDKRDIIMCADTVGGTGTFGSYGNRFFNNNQSLWQFGTSESERMSLQGRAGDTIICQPAPVNWLFLFQAVCQYYTFFNFKIDAVNMTSGDQPIKVYNGTTNTKFIILEDLEIANAYKDAVLLGGGTVTDSIVRSCYMHDYSRGVSNGLGVYCSGGQRNLITQSIASMATPYTSTGGFRIACNAGSISNDNIIEKNLVYLVGSSFVINGDNGILRNNWSRKCVGAHYQIYPVGGVTHDGIKVLHNAGYDQNTSGYRGLWMSSTPVTNTVYTNNIMAGVTTPVDLGGNSLAENLTNLTADPGWADPANDDFEITSADTTAYQQGTNKLSDVPDDFHGTTRDNPPDIGPFEVVELSNPNPVSGPYINVGALTCPRTYVFLGGGQ